MTSAKPEIVNLPREIIEIILQDKQISIEDVQNFGSSCKRFNIFTSDRSNKLWQRKFFQRWPKLREVYARERIIRFVKDWKKETIVSLAIRKRTVRLIEDVSSKSNFSIYKTSSIQQFKNVANDFSTKLSTYTDDFYNFIVNDSRVPLMIYDELIFHLKNNNASIRYYAKELLYFLQQMRITFRYQNFIKVPEKEKLEETAFCLAAEWMNPCDLIISSKIKLELQDLQSKVRIVLEQQYPSHQLLKMDKEVVNLWKRKNLSDNQFTINETRQILDCILQVMNSGGKESCSTATLSSASGSRVFDEPNLFILTEALQYKHKASRQALLIILKIIARRLGVLCEILTCSSNERDNRYHFLGWKESWAKDKSYCFFVPIAKTRYCGELEMKKGKPLSLEKVMMGLACEMIQNLDVKNLPGSKPSKIIVCRSNNELIKNFCELINSNAVYKQAITIITLRDLDFIFGKANCYKSQESVISMKLEICICASVFDVARFPKCLTNSIKSEIKSNNPKIYKYVVLAKFGEILLF